eukprot:3269183-Rhodomonas_salina.1
MPPFTQPPSPSPCCSILGLTRSLPLRSRGTHVCLPATLHPRGFPHFPPPSPHPRATPGPLSLHPLPFSNPTSLLPLPPSGVASTSVAQAQGSGCADPLWARIRVQIVPQPRESESESCLNHENQSPNRALCNVSTTKIRVQIVPEVRKPESKSRRTRGSARGSKAGGRGRERVWKEGALTRGAPTPQAAWCLCRRKRKQGTRRRKKGESALEEEEEGRVSARGGGGRESQR